MGKDFDRNFSKEYVEMTNDHMKRCSVSLAISSVQSLSHAWCFATPCTAGFPVYHQFLELDQIHVHRVGDAIHLCGPFSSCLQSLPASGSFTVTKLFASGGQNIGASASASVLPMNIQNWFPLGLTGLISLLSKGLSRVFSNTTVQKHQFFST